jgi:hypothetical protein
VSEDRAAHAGPADTARPATAARAASSDARDIPATVRLWQVGYRYVMGSEGELTLEEAALRLGVGAEEVWALVREDVLPARMDDHGRRYVPAAAVDELRAATAYREA